MFVKTRVHYIRMCILQIRQVSITNWVSSVLIQIVPNDVTTTQKMKFSIKDFFSTCDQSCSFLLIWSHLLKKSLMGSFIFCAMYKLIQLSHWKLRLSSHIKLRHLLQIGATLITNRVRYYKLGQLLQICS